MAKVLKPDILVSSIYAITPEGLKNRKIYGLILDIDNTLVATHIKDPDEKLINHLKTLRDGGIRAIIVSNARKERVEQFARPLNIEYVYKALKPLGRGFKLALKKLSLSKENVAIVGDQLFTDVLGGNLQGIHTILIKPIDLNEPLSIRLKRIIEKPFLINKRYEDKI